MQNIITLTQQELGNILAAVFRENGFNVELVDYVVAEGAVSVRVVTSLDGLEVFRRPKQEVGATLRDLMPKLTPYVPLVVGEVTNAGTG